MTRSLSAAKALNKSLKSNDNLQDYLRTHKPSKPLYLVSTDTAMNNARSFCEAFPGKPLYAVKVNPDPTMMKAIAQGGIHAFDVASLAEVQQVANVLPEAEMHFMHVVKSPEDIHAAYHDYGVRHFVLDHEDELFKIMRETDLAQDLSLTVRVNLPHNDSAKIDFSSKFGASVEEAIELLQKCRPISQKLGLSFHVGTQTTDAARYGQAIDLCADLLKRAGVNVDVLNVGGGFPVPYDDQPQVCTVQDCVDLITSALTRHGLSDLELVCEPGRVLVANTTRLVTRVELRKNDRLYLNDGIYGGLFDAAHWINTQYPISAISCDRPFDGDVQEFELVGPTCDAIDKLEGAYILPADIDMGDWIIFHQTGAYSQCLRSDFNGFGAADIVFLD